MAQKLRGKVALITGGTTGIGLASAKRFVAEGATVILTGTNPDTLESARAELGDGVSVIQSDVSNEQDVKKLFGQVAQDHGKIDVLFLNAGIAKFGPWPAMNPLMYRARNLSSMAALPLVSNLETIL